MRVWIGLLTLWASLGLGALVFMSTAFLWPNGDAGTVIVYAAQDQVYAEPILKDFEKTTGIRVRAVYDSEAVKTVGLANRLLAERERPQCDVFWGNEELRTRQLAALGVFRPTNGWVAFGHRSRRIAVPAGDPAVPAPQSWRELTNTIYRGRVALAYPLFGTTATHLQALRQHWGESNWANWCQALAANKPFIVDGNSVAVKFLERGEALLALTDSDDVLASRREGAPVQALPIHEESLLIPNTVAVIQHCPHPAAAEKLLQYLRSPAVVERLVAVGALESAQDPGHGPPSLRPDWERLLRDVDVAAGQLKQFFQR
jgi:iron(III) transport system substrate-binding protein